MKMEDEGFQARLQEAIADPKNLGEMSDADAVGTVGNPECGDMVRMWLKFTEKGGKKVIDRASFQSFGCQTAIAVASVATELLAGKTLEEARGLSADALSAPLGPLPPMKIHCGQMVEGALREALAQESGEKGGGELEFGVPTAGGGSGAGGAPTLIESLAAGAAGAGAGKRIKIVKLEP